MLIMIITNRYMSSKSNRTTSVAFRLSYVKKQIDKHYRYIPESHVSIEKNKFTAGVFRKDTFNGMYTNFNSFVALEHKFGIVNTLLHRRLSVIFPNFILKLKHLKKYFTKILFQQNLLTNVWEICQ